MSRSIQSRFLCSVPFLGALLCACNGGDGSDEPGMATEANGGDESQGISADSGGPTEPDAGTGATEDPDATDGEPGGDSGDDPEPGGTDTAGQPPI